MLSSLLSLGSSSLTFAQAAKDRDGQPTVSVYLQPYDSLSHVPQTPIMFHPPRSHNTHTKHKKSCPFGSTPLQALCPLNHCRNCSTHTKDLRAQSLKGDCTTHLFAKAGFTHTPLHFTQQHIILRLTPLSGPCISLEIRPDMSVSNLLPLIHRCTDVTAATDLWYVTNPRAPRIPSRLIHQPASDFAPISFLTQSGQLRAGCRQNFTPPANDDSSLNSACSNSPPLLKNPPPQLASRVTPQHGSETTHYSSPGLGVSPQPTTVHLD